MGAHGPNIEGYQYVYLGMGVVVRLGGPSRMVDGVGGPTLLEPREACIRDRGGNLWLVIVGVRVVIRLMPLK